SPWFILRPSQELRRTVVCNAGCYAPFKGPSSSRLHLSSSRRLPHSMYFVIMFMIYILSSMLESCMLGLILIMINLVRNLNLQLSIFPTIQKPYYRQSVDLTMAGFAESLRLEKFTGVNFKIWKSKVRLWFTAMHIWDMRFGKPEGVLTVEEQKKYDEANNLFVGCIISNLSD